MNLRDPQEIPEEEYFGDFKDLNQDQKILRGFGTIQEFQVFDNFNKKIETKSKQILNSRISIH